MNRGDNNTIRIATYNVHGFRDVRFENNESRVESLLRSLNLDVICLQEVDTEESKDVLVRLALALDMQVIIGPIGNALLTRLNIVHHRNWKLIEYRGLMHATLEFDSSPIGIYCTHLDHIGEPVRLQQWSKIMTIIDDSGRRDHPHVILGDFNALMKEDYTAEQLNEICEVRKKGRWETARFDLTEIIQASGYIDLLSLADSKPFVPTSRFNTRIDYGWANRSFLESFKLSDTNTIVNDCSDHNLILFELNKL